MDTVQMNYTSFSGIVVLDAINLTNGQFLDVWFNVGKNTIASLLFSAIIFQNWSGHENDSRQ